jgi:hypothetical protein
LFTPLRLLDSSVANMLQPDIAYHAARQERAAVWRQAGIWTLILGCGSLLYGSAISIVVPMYDMRVFEGTSIRLIGAFVWAIYAASELRVMPRIILEVVGQLRTIALISGVSAVTGMTIVAAILAVAAPQWSLLGALVSEVMALVGFWLALTVSLGIHSPKEPFGQRTWRAS